jgi:outer membrane cobalamin receptor
MYGPRPETLYGSDSVGGTIYIITKKGTEIPELFALFEGGSLSHLMLTAGVRGKPAVKNR